MAKVLLLQHAWIVLRWLAFAAVLAVGEPQYLLSSSARCPAGATSIKTIDECRAAAALLDLRRREPAAVTRAEAPSGCYKDNSADARVYFNAGGSEDSLEPELRAICAWSVEPPEDEQLGYLGSCSRDALDMDHSKIAVRSTPPMSTELPPGFDSRTRWPYCFSTPVRSQAGCGSCWAFATTAVVRQRACIEDCRANGRCNASNVLHARQFSVQHIMSCSAPESKAGCQGGLAHMAYESMQDVAAWEYDLPYKCGGGSIEDQFDRGTTRSCKKWPWGVDTSAMCPRVNDHVKVTGYYRLPLQGTPTFSVADRMAAELIEKGPLAVDFCVRINFFSFWRSDKTRIYTEADGCQHGQIVGGHMVMLVGFGTQQQDGASIRYWTLENSWGKVWGHDGFFYMQRGVNLCGIENKASAVDVTVSSDTPPPPSSTTLTTSAAPGSTTRDPAAEVEEDSETSEDSSDFLVKLLLALAIIGFLCWFLTCAILCFEKRRFRQRLKEMQSVPFLGPSSDSTAYLGQERGPASSSSFAPSQSDSAASLGQERVPAASSAYVPSQSAEVLGKTDRQQPPPSSSQGDIHIQMNEEPGPGGAASASRGGSAQRREHSPPSWRREPTPIYSDNVKQRMQEERRKNMY